MTKLDEIRQRDQAWSHTSNSNASQAANDRRLLLMIIDALVREHADHAQRLVGLLK